MPAEARVRVWGPDGPSIERLVPRALERLDARGFELRDDVEIRTYASRDEFVAATKIEAPELRAWTTFATVNLAPLATWSSASDDDVERRIAHELCHAAIYQRFGSAERARNARVPRFFSEGACAIVAGQPAPAFVVDDVSALSVETFAADPTRAYHASYSAMRSVEKRLDPRSFAEIVALAAADGSPGSIERVLRKKLGMTIPQLWQAVLDDEGAKQ